MKDNIHFLPPHSNMTVKETFATAERAGLEDVIIIGYDKDGDFIVNSSNMSRQEALWLIKRAELHALDIK